MASDVDICNLALAQLGDAAKVASLNPPDQSAQAGHCARFYPMARDALLEMHTWSFATVRVALAAVALPPTVSTWNYAYAIPSDVLNFLAVLDPSTTDDYSVGLQLPNTLPQVSNPGVGVYQPQAYAIENYNGVDVLLTNQQNAVLRYTAAVSDPTKFSPLFVQGLATLLASHLAGPVLKGSEGRQTQAAKLAEFMKWKEFAVESDSNQRVIKPQQGATWMIGR